MIIVMRPHAPDEEIQAVEAAIVSLELTAHVSRGAERTIVGVIGAPDDKDALRAQFVQLDGVEQVILISRAYKLVSREAKPEPTVVRVKAGVSFGGKTLGIAAGPCSIESREQVRVTAEAVAAAGANLLRGGAFKPRTSPYAFQGLGQSGLEFMHEAADRYGLAVVTEVLDPRDVELVAEHADMLQIGARNMQNFTLLREVGYARKPVLLKRGDLRDDRRVVDGGRIRVTPPARTTIVLCERGIRSYDTHTRNLLDLAAVAVLRYADPLAGHRRSLALRPAFAAWCYR